MDTQLVYPFRSRRRNFDRRQRWVKNFRGVAVRKHRGIGEWCVSSWNCYFFPSTSMIWKWSERETCRTGNCVNLFREADTLLTLFHLRECGVKACVPRESPSRPIDGAAVVRGRQRTTRRNYVISSKFHFDYSWNPCLCLTSNFHFESINQARDDSMHRHEDDFRVNWSRSHLP